MPPTALLESEGFDSNPKNYYSFIDAFEALIEYNVLEPKHYLYFLLQYTKGPTQVLVYGVNTCHLIRVVIKPENCLQQTFGQRFQIAKA